MSTKLAASVDADRARCLQDRVFYDTGLAVGTSGKPLWEESLEGLIDELDYIKANCKRHMRRSPLPMQARHNSQADRAPSHYAQLRIQSTARCSRSSSSTPRFTPTPFRSAHSSASSGSERR